MNSPAWVADQSHSVAVGRNRASVDGKMAVCRFVGGLQQVDQALLHNSLRVVGAGPYGNSLLLDRAFGDRLEDRVAADTLRRTYRYPDVAE